MLITKDFLKRQLFLHQIEIETFQSDTLKIYIHGQIAFIQYLLRLMDRKQRNYD